MAVAENIDLIALIDGMMPDFHAATIATLDFWSQQDLLDWADEGVKRLAKEAACWVERYTSITTVNGTRAYALATRHIATLQVSYGTNPLRPASAAELEAKDAAYQTTAATEANPPAHWYEDLQRAEYVSVVPVPVAAVNLPIIQTIYPEPVGNDFSVREYIAGVAGATVGPGYAYDHEGTLEQAESPSGSPVTISTDKYEFAVGGRQSSRGEFSFEYGGDLYLVASNLALDGSGNIHVLKSTDDGATWAELDSGNAPDSNPGVQLAFGDAWSAVVDGDSLVIVGAKYGGTGQNSLPYSVVFNLAAGTWGSESEYLAPTIYTLTGTHTQFQLIKRGTGDYVLFYSSSLNKAGYVTFNGSAFGSPVDIPGQPNGTWPVSGVVDSDGTTHFLMWSNAAVTRQALHISLLSNGTFGTLQTVLGTSNTYAVYYGTSILSDIKILTVGAAETLAFATCGELQSDTNVAPMIYVSAPIATNPTWTVAEIESGAPEDLLPDMGDNWPMWVPVTLAQAADGTIYVIWTHTVEVAGVNVGAFWESHSTDGATWTAHTSLFDTSAVTNEKGWTAEQAYAVSTTAGIAIFGVSGDAVGDVEGGPYLLTQTLIIAAAPATPDKFYLSGIVAGQQIIIVFDGTAATITLMDNPVDRNVYATYNDTASFTWTVPEGVTSAWLEASITA